MKDTHKAWLTRCLLLFAACAGLWAFWWIREAERPLLAHGSVYTFSDADSFMRARLIQDAAAGGLLNPRTWEYHNWPEGIASHWTAPNTMAGLGIFNLMRLFAPDEEAARMSAFYLGPVLGSVSLLLLAWLGWRTGGWMLALAWMLAWPALDDVLAVTRLGCADHHALHQMLMIVAAGLLVSSQRSRATGILTGLAAGIATWSAALELAPFLASMIALGITESRGARDAARHWRAVWITASAITLLGIFVEYGSGPWSAQLEYLSMIHLPLWLLAGALLEYSARRPRPSLQATAAGIAAGVGILLVLTAHGFDPRHIMAVQDPFVARQLEITREFAPFPAAAVRMLLVNVFWKYGLLPLLALGLLQRVKNIPARLLWLVLLTGFYAFMLRNQLRWADGFAALIVLAAGLGSRNLFRQKPVIALLAVIAAMLPPWIYTVSISRNMRGAKLAPEQGPFAELHALQAVADCAGDQENPPVMLAPWDFGGPLAASGRLLVIGSAFWTNQRGMNETHQLFTTSSRKEFIELARANQVRYLLLPAPVRVTQLIGHGFYVLHGRPPVFEELDLAFIWKVATDPALTAVACPEMLKFQPGWRLMDISPLLGNANR